MQIKRRRHQILAKSQNFTATAAYLEDEERFNAAAEAFKPDVIVHPAAQAGVRYSLENRRAYLDRNIVRAFDVMEAAQVLGVNHLLMASTSSVYGANEDMPFTETEKADT